MKLTVSPEAASDLERLRAFLSYKNPAAADRAIAVLTAAVQSLAPFPERGRPSSIPNLRDLIVPFGQSAYVVRHRYSAPGEEVVLLRIWLGVRRAIFVKDEDGLYTDDPKKNPSASFISQISAAELLRRDLGDLVLERVVIEYLPRARFCRELQIVNGLKPGMLTRALAGENVGTIITAD